MYRLALPWKFIDAAWGGVPPQLRTTALNTITSGGQKASWNKAKFYYQTSRSKAQKTWTRA